MSILRSVLGMLGLRAPLARVRQILRDPRTEKDLLADYWSFRKRYNFLAEGAHLINPDKVALVVSLSDWVAHVKAESMLAKALQLQGYTPVIVTNRPFQRALKYFRVFGFDKFIYFQDLMEHETPDDLAVEAQAVLGQAPTLQSLLAGQYRGVDLGRHVLSSVARSLRHGSIEFSDPRVYQLLKRLVPQSIRSIRAAEILMDRTQPQLVLFLEKGYTPYGEIFDVAVNRGINTIQWVHSHRADALALKRYTRQTRDLHPFSLSSETWEMVRQMPWTSQRELELDRELRGRYEEGTWFNRKYLDVGKKIKTSEEVREQLGLDPGKKTAIIFSHVLWDATFFYGENLFADYEEWLVETVRAACANRGVNWIIKLHPDYVWKLKQLGAGDIRDQVALDAKIGPLPDHVRVLQPDTDISTYSLFAVTDYCLTVRGTIGIEMPCFGIPVFTAGTGRYSGFGFTIDSHSREDYLAKVRNIQDFPRLSEGQVELAKKHAYGLFWLRPLRFESFEMVRDPLDKLGHSLDSNVVIRPGSFRDLAEAPDLRTFAEWAIASKSLDYLMPLPDSTEAVSHLEKASGARPGSLPR